jgi:predicted RNA-binding Zn-ribbon protein involved in translation (DUF1610 family)
MSMKCPHCGSSHVRRSHIRPWELLIKPFTPKRPHRCEDCRWRGWVIHVRHKHGEHPRLHTAEATVAQPGEPDLTAIDSSLSKK